MFLKKKEKKENIEDQMYNLSIRQTKAANSEKKEVLDLMKPFKEI